MRMLAAVDVREHGDAVATAAGRWADRLGATVDLAYAAGTAAPDADKVTAIAGLFGDGEPPYTGRDVLDDLAQGLPPAVRGGVRVLPGRPLDALPRASEGYDLVVLGTHGRSGLARLALGSVADRVVRTAACPTLVLPITGRLGPGRAGRILAATDLSERSMEALEKGIALMKPSHLDVVHVITGVQTERVHDRSATEHATAAVGSHLAHHDVRADVVHVLATTRQNAGDEIARLGGDLDVDAIVLGSRGLGTVLRLALGSVTERVLHNTTVPVLVVPG